MKQDKKMNIVDYLTQISSIQTQYSLDVLQTNNATKADI